MSLKNLSRVFLALVLFPMLVCFLSQSSTIHAAKPSVWKKQAKKLVAARLGIPAKQLKVIKQAKGQYPLIGVKTRDFKVFDKVSGESYTITLDMDRNEVDSEALLSAEETAKLERYGKLEPELAEQVASGAAGAPVRVILWLRMDDFAGADRPVANDSQESFSQEQVDAVYARADAVLAESVQRVSAPVADRLRGMGVEVETDAYTPVVYAGLDAAALNEASSWDEVQEVYLDRVGEPTLDIARSTILANVVNSRGVTGSGVQIGQIESKGGRIATANPYLAGVTQNTTYVCSTAHFHATGVAGILRSTHSTRRGIASGMRLWAGGSCSGDGNQLQNRSTASADWGAKALNLSWGAFVSSRTPISYDRFYDSMVINRYRTIVVAAGNEAGTCNSRTGNVLSPGMAYNVITVGNFDDRTTVSWSGDTIESCSSWRDPASVRNDREKPEVSAPGANINGTTTASPWTGGIGSGTSYAAPMVTGTVALLIQRNSRLASWPEGVKAILIASAVHNIEGGSRLSEYDGAGGIVSDRADDIARGVNGTWNAQTYSCSNSSNLDVTSMYLYAGTRTRVAIAWDNDPNYSSYASQPGADLDLKIIGPSNALVASSTSYDNTYEIVDFTPSTTGYYKLRVAKVRCNYSPRFLGWAWRRGN